MTARTVFALLLLVSGLVAWFVLSDDAPDDEEPGLDLAALVPDPTRRISVESAGSPTVEVVRRDAGWNVDGYPARDSLIDAALASLRTAPPLRLIARSEATHERMGLADTAALRVTLSGPAGAPPATLLVGDEGRDGRFVRLPGSESAFVAPGGLLDAFVRPAGEWRDFTILQADTAAIARIVIRREGRVVADLRRARAGGGARWTAWKAGDAIADPDRMRLYLETLARLDASGFPADTFVFAADFENPVATVELYAEDAPGLAPSVTLLFSTALDHPHILVRRGDRPIVYAVDRVRATFLTSTGESIAAG